MMSLAPWRSPLARALHRNRSRPESRYAQLATLRPNGRPANRTVVFRGFVPDDNSLLFVTDQRSDKVGHLLSQPAVELCWYFAKTREQFRIAGQMQVITAADVENAPLRDRAWESLSDNARQSFSWPPPGHPRQREGFDTPLMASAPPLETFVLLRLVPDWVDHLELRGDPQTRHQYHQVAGLDWVTQAVNP